MAYYTVQKTSGKRWEVLKDGYSISKHNSKSNAVQKAKKEMSDSDGGVVKKANGKFQRKL